MTRLRGQFPEMGQEIHVFPYPMWSGWGAAGVEGVEPLTSTYRGVNACSEHWMDGLPCYIGKCSSMASPRCCLKDQVQSRLTPTAGSTRPPPAAHPVALGRQNSANKYFVFPVRLSDRSGPGHPRPQRLAQDLTRGGCLVNTLECTHVQICTWAGVKPNC